MVLGVSGYLFICAGAVGELKTGIISKLQELALCAFCRDKETTSVASRQMAVIAAPCPMFSCALVCRQGPSSFTGQ